MATLPELESVSVLLHFYGKMLPLGGIVRTASKGIHQLDRGFYGAGLPHPGVEAMVEQSNKLLMHYGCSMALGNELQTFLDLLLVELGIHFNPSRDLTITRTLAMWLPLVGLSGFAVMVHNLQSVFPRDGDHWLMARFIALGCTGKDLWTLNRVRKNQQVLFLSDILGAGKRLKLKASMYAKYMSCDFIILFSTVTSILLGVAKNSR